MHSSTEFFLLNLNASEFCQKRLADYGSRSLMARVNLAVHPYVYPNAIIGDEIKEEVLEIIYTTQKNVNMNLRNLSCSNLIGIEECNQDPGKLRVNRVNFL